MLEALTLYLGYPFVILTLWVVVKMCVSLLKTRKLESEPYHLLWLTVTMAYAMLFYIKAEAFSGFLGTFGLCFFTLYLGEKGVMDRIPGHWPWWVSVLSFITGIGIFVVYAKYSENLPPFFLWLSWWPATIIAIGLTFGPFLAATEPKRTKINIQ